MFLRFLMIILMFAVSSIALAVEDYQPVNQVPFSSPLANPASDSLFGPNTDSNNIYPDKEYFEYAGERDPTTCDPNNPDKSPCPSREPVPYKIGGGNNKEGLCDATGECHYPTNKWFIDLAFLAKNRKGTYEDFRTSTGPFNVRVTDDYRQVSDTDKGYTFWPGLSFSASKKPYVVVAGKSDPLNTDAPSLHNYFSDIYPSTLQANSDIEIGFGIPGGYDVSKFSRYTTAFDQMSYTTQWNAINPDDSLPGSMESPIVRGSPYMTMIYNNLPVDIFSPEIGYVSAACDDCTDKEAVELDNIQTHPFSQGQIFRVFVLSDNYSASADKAVSSYPVYENEYILFFSKPVNLYYTNVPPAPSYKHTHDFQVVDAQNKLIHFTGTVRIGYVGSYASTTSDIPTAAGETMEILNHSSSAPVDFTAQENIIKQYANVYPVSADIQLASDGNGAQVTYQWKTQTIGGLKNSNNAQLLMTAFDETHRKLYHLDSTPGIQILNNYQIESLKGMMTGVVGDTWQLQFPYPSVLSSSSLNDGTVWRGPAINNANYKKLLQDQYNADFALIDVDPAKDGLRPPSINDSYAFGKQIARLARLALIGESLGDTANVTKTLIPEIEDLLQPWLNKGNADDRLGQQQGYLRYDPYFGGTITAKASFSPQDCENHKPPYAPTNCGYNSDFYNGQYTDHYFHYGYFLYTAAVVAHFDSEWLKNNKEKVNLLARDIANPSADDVYFPQYRHFDWFEGHAFANGLGPTAVGRNEESTSEALNAWYGLTLWGIVTNNDNMRDIGRILTAMEMDSDQVWEQINPDTSFYKDFHVKANTNFNSYNQDINMQNHIVTGIDWQMKLDYMTFFGNTQNYVLGIQMMPYTPITFDYYTKDFVKANMGNFNNAINLAKTKLSDFASPTPPDSGNVLGKFKDEYDNDIAHRSGNIAAKDYWAGTFETATNGTYIWSLIVDPIIAAATDDPQSADKAYQIIRFDNNGDLMQIMNNINLSFENAYNEAIKINPFDPQKVKGTVFQCQPPKQSTMCIYPDEDPNNAQFGNWPVGNFAKLNYNGGIDPGETKSNILWWIAIHAPADVTPLKPPVINSPSRDSVDPTKVGATITLPTGGTEPYAYTCNFSGSSSCTVTVNGTSATFTGITNIDGELTLTVTDSSSPAQKVTSQAVEVKPVTNPIIAPVINNAYRNPGNKNTVIVNYTLASGGVGTLTTAYNVNGVPSTQVQQKALTQVWILNVPQGANISITVRDSAGNSATSNTVTPQDI